MKLETYLRLAKIPYTVKQLNNPGRAPKGKLPFIKDGEQVVADSGFIIEYLKNKYGDPLDKDLTPIQKGQSVALQRLFEEHLYWVIAYMRWVEPSGWEVIQKSFFGFMPFLVRKIIPNLIRRKLKKTLYSQGIGRHTREEIYSLGKQDITAFAALLNVKPFVHGDKPTSIDACAYAFLACILLTPVDSPLKTFAKSIPELSAYCERMAAFHN